MPLEQQAKQDWPYAPDKHSGNGAADVMVAVTNEVTVVRRQSFIARAIKSLKRRARGDDQTIRSQSNGKKVQRRDSMASLTAGEKGWLLKLMQETSLGDFIRDLV
jgi:phosphotransferase system HPr-like phosphotransfer protein